MNYPLEGIIGVFFKSFCYAAQFVQLDRLNSFHISNQSFTN